MQPTEPSKTQRKHEMHARQALGERLVELSDDQLAQIDLPEGLREAIGAAKRMRSREALRRQLQYIGRLMREVDPAPIQAQLEQWHGRTRVAVERHHRIEEWRERLVGDDAGIARFTREYPHAERQTLLACVRAARAEQRAGKPHRHWRALFRMIRDVIDAVEAA